MCINIDVLYYDYHACYDIKCIHAGDFSCPQVWRCKEACAVQVTAVVLFKIPG